MEENIIKIETKLAYLEEMVLTLNSLVITQAREIEMLKGAKEKMEAKLNQLSEASFDLEESKPPHY
ncbi:MAG: SlyX family protein [Sphaerochaetaceae bacterium]